MSNTHTAGASDDRSREDIALALHDWLDLHTTKRRVIARRTGSRPMPILDGLMLKSAFDLVADGRISIITRKGDGVTTFYAERI